MSHASEQELQLLLDGELDAQAADRVRRHLEICAECRSSYDEMERLCGLVRASAAEASEAASDGAFWAALTAEMDERPQQSSWQWLQVLPPALLTLLGSMVHVLAGLALVIWSAYQFGLPGPLGQWLSDAAAEMAKRSLWGVVYQLWEGFDPTARSLLVAAAVVLASTAVFSATALLMVSWALCWREPARRNGFGGR